MVDDVKKALEAKAGIINNKKATVKGDKHQELYLVIPLYKPDGASTVKKKVLKFIPD